MERAVHKIDAASAETLKHLKRTDGQTSFTVVIPDFRRGTETTATSETFVIVPHSREQVAAIKTQLVAMGAKRLV